MIGLALLLGIALAMIVATQPAEKLLFGPPLKVLIAFIFSIFAGFIFFMVMRSTDTGSYLVGKVFGCVIIVVICVAIGNVIRKKKGKK
jgi:CDP-diglyceride synthetase